MPSLPLAKGNYQRFDNTPVRLTNAYFEQDPTNVRDQMSLIPRPGLATFATLAGPSVAGMIRREDSDETVLCVSGTVAQVVSPEGIVTAAGTGLTGTNRVSMAADGANIMIARAGLLYVQTGTTVTLVEMPDDILVLNVVFLAGRFWIATELDGRVYFTVPGETTVDALNYFSAESAPDPLVGIAVSGDELILLGRSSVEYWTPTGDQDLPATRVVGRASKVGCASMYSIGTGDLVAWVGDDCMVYRSGDALPVPIGDAGLSAIIRKARPALDETDPAKTLNGWTFSIENHTFYVLDIPGHGTQAFDFMTNQWCELTSVDHPLFNAGCGVKLSEGRWLAGGTFDGKVRLFSPDALEDDEGPIVRVYPALLPVRSTEVCHNVVLECTVGSATLVYPVDNPRAGCRFSRNGGRTWSDWTYTSLGQQGDYDLKPSFRGLGRMEAPSHLFEFRISDPVPFVLRAARYNEGVN